MNMSLLAALAVIASAIEFHTPDGAAGRADDLGGGVWRVRVADSEGRFAERGAIQALAAFMGEEVPSFGAPDGSRAEVVEKPFALRFYSKSGRLVREITSLSAKCGGQADARPAMKTDGFAVKGSLPAGEGVYGFGERLDRLNQRGQKILLCSSDGWNKSDTTYAPIPFFVTTSGAGVFVNDYGTITADMGAAKVDEWSVTGSGRRIDLYVWATDRMLDAVKGVHRLQGGSLTPPDWAKGPVICRYAPDLSVLDGYTCKKYVKRKYWEGKALLGVGVKEMLSRYEAMGAKPRAFIMEGWNIEMFGDSDIARKRREALKACGEFLKSKDVKMLVYMRVGSPIDRKCPGFKDEFLVHADVFKDGKLDRSNSDRIPDVYLTGININPDSGKVAGGNAALDITNPEMWNWYVNVVWKQLVDIGVSGVKIDFCEELPDDGCDYGAVRVKYKWHDKGVFDGAAVHHAYPAFFVSRFTREMSRLTEGKGGFMVLTRGGGIGSGRNPYMWAGDQTRSWDKLDDQLLAVLNSGMSGIPFMSYDYGGYQYDGGSRVEPAGVMNLKTGAFDPKRTTAAEGEETVYVRRGKTLSAEDEERIFSRALAFTSFMPCMQSHGYVRNVYEFGEATRRQYAAAVAEREKLAPYIRKAVVAAAKQGVPMASPLVLKWQDDPNTYSIADEFMFGDEILVAPVLGPGETREVYLPCGEWKERATGKIHRAGREGLRLSVRAPAGGVPIFRMAKKEDLRGPEAWLEFMGGNVRTDGLRCDLEAIKEAGFSGVHFFHINHGVKGAWPDCPAQIPCMSEKWGDVMRYLGDECARLDLKLTVQNCPGWSQSGGPWIDLDHCQRDVECARRDLEGGETLRLPDVPEKFRDANSDWRDICVLAFPTPLGDDGGMVPCGRDKARPALKPVSVETNGDERVYTFAEPVTIRSMTLPGLHAWNSAYGYHMPWRRVSLEAKTAEGWRDSVRTPLPTSSWRDYVYTFTVACDEQTAKVWRYRLEHDFPVRRWGEPEFFAAARQTDWEAKSARVLRSLLDERPPKQDRRAWVDASRIVDLTGVPDWKAPSGKWTVLRFGHVNSKRVNSPAPKEATGWECDKLDPKGIEANFKGYVGMLQEGPLKGRMHGMLVDSWECFGQTWTARMEEYFRNANGYDLRKHLPSLFGYVVDSPDATERFLTDWRRTNGDLITKNYFGRMAELAHEAGLASYYETAFGDIVFGDLLEYWKYADSPMCEFWYPHATKAEGGVGSYAFKPIRPCASAAHVYGKRRVVAEAFTGGNGISWDEDFKNLQDIANRHFARGVTHLAYQSYTHAPAPDATPPGGCMGGFNGTPFTRLQTWWKHMPEFNGYIVRCEEFLEAGLPAQDVLWYLGDAVDHKPDEDYPFPEGFRADYLNHDVLTNRLAVKDGLFTIPEGTTWKVLWVPDERFMLPATRKRLSELATAGGKVVFGGKEALVAALKDVPKDVATEPSLGDEPSEDFMWIHRKVDGFDRYFVAAGTKGWRGKVTFRAKGDVSVFDPVSLERTSWRNGDVLEIPPSRSVFVEFGIAGSQAESSDSNKTAKPVKWKSLTGWTLSFPSGWGAPEKVELESPVSWTEIPGFTREAQAFSGTATYETEFDCDAEDGGKVELDLGRVESVAKVYVNGKPVRTLWCEPYRCRIDGFVKKGRNSLRIEVTSTWRNRVIYDLGRPKGERKTWMLYDPRFSPSPKDPFIPSGIVGPVRLLWVDASVGLKLSDRIAARHKILKQDVWYGHSRITFDFDGYTAWIVEPEGEWAQGHPWTWTMQWAEAYVERTGVLDLIAEGWRHVTIDTFRHRMDSDGLRVSRAFQKYLVEELGFAPKAKLVGMSWGGFFSVRYAESFPECVDRIYLDAPLLTLGGGFGVTEGAPSGAAAEIGPWAAMPPKDGDWLSDPRMPVNMAAAIAKAGIPIFLLYGGQDQTVKPSFNCEPFAERFKAAGGDITVRRRFAYGHHPHGEEHGRTCRIAEFLKGPAAR